LQILLQIPFLQCVPLRLTARDTLLGDPPRGLNRGHDVVLPSRVDVSVLRVLRDVCQVDPSLLRLGRTTVSGMHIPDGTGDADSISNLSVEIPIVPSNGHAAIVSY